MVPRPVKRSAVGKGRSSKKRTGSSSERPERSFKARRTSNPPSFNDSNDFMDTTFDDPQLPGKEKAKSGRVGVLI